MSSPRQEKLSRQVVVRGHGTTQTELEVDIIAVPGIGSPPVASWGLSDLFKNMLDDVEGISKLVVLSYDYDIGSDGQASWHNVLECGNALLEAMKEMKDQAHNNQRPLLFVCHGLGGTVLKQALNVASQQRQMFSEVWDDLKGVVFLGTPHNGRNDKDTWAKHMSLLTAFSKPHSKQPTDGASASDIRSICSPLAQFERNIADVSILSLCDGCDTKVSRLFKSKYLKFVDRTVAKISPHNEEIIVAPLSHQDLCMLYKDDDTISRVRNWFKARLREAARAAPRPRVAVYSRQFVSTLLPRSLQKGPESLQSSSTLASVASSAPSVAPSAPSVDPRPSISQSTPQQSGSEVPTLKPQFPCFMVHRHGKNTDFFGREEELLKLDQYLLQPRDGTSLTMKRYALCGMGGIGKTDLALQFAHTRKDKFRAVFWIDAAERSQIATEFAAIAPKLGLIDSREAQDIVTCRERFKSWMESTEDVEPDARLEKGVPWLLIFDNADSLAILEDYCPMRGAGSILITSRDPGAKVFWSFQIAGLDLDPFSEKEAARFVKRITSCDDTEEELSACSHMAKQLGCLPLAIIQMAGVIRRRDLSVHEFIRMIETDEKYLRLRNIDSPVQLRRYGSTLATAWNFDDLKTDSLNLLKIISLLNPDRIQENLFANALAAPPTGFAFLRSEDDFQEAREDLLSSSIIRRDRKSKELWIHRVVSQEVRARMDDEEFQRIYEVLVKLLAGVWPFNALEKRHSTSRWKICEMYSPHLELLLKFQSEKGSKLVPGETDRTLAALLQEAGAYFHERGFSYDGKNFLVQALELCNRSTTTDESDPLLSDIHYTLGAIANEINDGKSCLKHNLVLFDMRKKAAASTGKPDVRFAAAHSQLGVAYTMMGKLALATELFAQSVAMFRSLDNFMVDMMAFPMANYGLGLWLQDQIEEAEEVFVVALKEREQEFGKMDTVSYKTGRILHGLGNVLESKALALSREGKSADATELMSKSFQYHERSLTQLESVFGGYHHRVADLCHKLAGHHIRWKEDSKAQALMDRALRIWGSRLWYNNQVARTTFLKGTHLVSMGGDREVEGRACIQRAKEMRSAIIEDDGCNETDAKGDAEPNESDFDELVVFWSR